MTDSMPSPAAMACHNLQTARDFLIKHDAGITTLPSGSTSMALAMYFLRDAAKELGYALTPIVPAASPVLAVFDGMVQR